MKISQTWLASHTGPIEWSITSRGRSPRVRAAGDEIPEPGAEVGAAEDGVGRDGEEQHHGDRVVLMHTVTSSRGRRLRAPVRAGRTARRRRPRRARRKRLLILRRISTVVIPSPAYSTATRMNVIQTPVLAVAASSTFIWL